MTKINELLRAVCTELGSQIRLLKNQLSAEQSISEPDSPRSGIVCVEEDVNKPRSSHRKS